MKLKKTLEIVKNPPDVAPLVDVVLLLLVFFILTSSFVYQPGIRIDLPAGNGEGATGSRYIVAITNQDPPQLFFNDQLTDLKGIDQAFAQLAQQQADLPIMIQADERVDHGLVVKVMNLALAHKLPVIIATQPL